MKVVTRDITSTTSYKLVQLPPSVLDEISKGGVCLKSGKHPVLTTTTSTYRVRQQNTSNTVLLVKDDTAYIGFSSYLVLDKTQPCDIDYSHVAKMEINTLHDFPRDSDDPDTLYNALSHVTPMSPKEFESATSKDTTHYTHHDKVAVVAPSLQLHLLGLIAEHFAANLPDQTVTSVVASQQMEMEMGNSPLLRRVLRRLIANYTAADASAVDATKHARLATKLFLTGPTQTTDLLVHLRITVRKPVDLRAVLSGMAYTHNDVVYPLTITETTAAAAFARLFSLKPTWPLWEVAPFVASLNRKNEKMEKFARRYARLKNGVLTKKID